MYHRDKLVNLVVLSGIVLLALLAAWVTFSFLQSQGSAHLRGYSIGGGVAGFAFSVTLLGSLYLGFRREDGLLERLGRDKDKELEQLRTDKDRLLEKLRQDNLLDELRAENRSLHQRLLRGGPRPEEFETEVSERHKVVLARPRSWASQGGVLFAYQEMPREGHDDRYLAKFKLSFSHIDTVDAESYEDYYRQLQESAEDQARKGNTSHPSFETDELGGQEQGIPTLTIQVSEFYEVHAIYDRVTKKPSWISLPVSQDKYLALQSAQGVEEPSGVVQTRPRDASPLDTAMDRHDTPLPLEDSRRSPFMYQSASHSVAVAEDDEHPEPLLVKRRTVVCYHRSIGLIYFFDFWDDERDFPSTSAQFNALLRSIRFLS